MTFPFSTWFPDAPIDGSYGRDETALRGTPPLSGPDDFADVWRARYAIARAMDAEPVLRELAAVGGRRVFEVAFTASGGVRLRGWFAATVGDAPARLGVVHGHGYGGRDAPDFSRVPDDAAVIFPVARGLGTLNVGVGVGVSADPDDHVLAGIEDRDGYVVGRCAVDLWHAASALIALAGEVPLYLIGESFGGGIGALALPWDDRFVGATLIVPTFGDHDLRLGLASNGSGEAVRRYVAQHPEAREVLRYADASSAALHTFVPVRVECALWDTYVAAPSQFAVANGYADLELDVFPAGHAEYPGMDAALARRRAATLRHVEGVMSGRDARG